MMIMNNDKYIGSSDRLLEFKDFEWMDELKLITNFDEDKLPIYQKAIERYEKETEDNSLYIKDVAFDKNGNVVKNSYALHYKYEKSKYISKFWDILEELKNES